MTVTRMVLHNLAARTLRVGLRAGEATATGLRCAGYAALAGAVTIHTVLALVVLGGSGGAAVTGGLWLRRKVERWRGDGPVFLQPPTRRAPASTARRGPSRGAGVKAIPPGSLVEVLHPQAGERGTWQVVDQAPTRARGRGGMSSLIVHLRTGNSRIIDTARLVIVAPPPPAARPLAKAMARDSARGKGRAALPDPLRRADTLQTRSAALQANATTARRRASAVTAAATRGRQRAERATVDHPARTRI
jgi:hypothetical protein